MNGIVVVDAGTALTKAGHSEVEPRIVMPSVIDDCYYMSPTDLVGFRALRREPSAWKTLASLGASFGLESLIAHAVEVFAQPAVANEPLQVAVAIAEREISSVAEWLFETDVARFLLKREINLAIVSDSAASARALSALSEGSPFAAVDCGFRATRISVLSAAASLESAWASMQCGATVEGALAEELLDKRIAQDGCDICETPSIAARQYRPGFLGSSLRVSQNVAADMAAHGWWHPARAAQELRRLHSNRSSLLSLLTPDIIDSVVAMTTAETANAPPLRLTPLHKRLSAAGWRRMSYSGCARLYRAVKKSTLREANYPMWGPILGENRVYFSRPWTEDPLLPGAAVEANVSVEGSGGSVTEWGAEAFLVPEQLFGSAGIGHVVNCCIRSMQPALPPLVAVHGGISLLPGFAERLQLEIGNAGRVVRVDDPLFCSWRGAAALAREGRLSFITAAEYGEHGRNVVRRKALLQL